MAKMITCKHCGAEIAASAKVCPHCGGKNAKPIFKKWWFWVIVVFIGIGIAFGSGNKSESKKVGEVNAGNSSSVSTQPENSGDGETAAEATGSESATASEPVKTVYNVGDILEDGNMRIVYISSGDYTSDNQFIHPSEGNKYIFLEFAFINTSDKKDASVSFYNFECYADGYHCDMFYGGNDDLSAKLSAGRSTTGYVYFEVPQNAQEIEIEYDTNYFSADKITFVFEGNQDSGYVLETNTSATEGAIAVGEIAESSQLNITYISCEIDTSYNQFMKPKAGYHYVTCTFEFENKSNSDEIISMYSFDCYADGISCDQAYFRDDTINATLSAGRKAKGTVTFEVPDGATVVEVEYLTNFWTSNRVVFNAS